MKKHLIAAAIALPMTSPALFADDTNMINIAESFTAVKMSNDDLSAVKGQAFDICVSCFAVNNAFVTQANASLFSVGVLQSNSSHIDQSNN